MNNLTSDHHITLGYLVCLAVYGKIGKEGFVRSVEVKDLDVIITDWESSEEELDKIRDMGVEVVVVDKP